MIWKQNTLVKINIKKRNQTKKGKEQIIKKKARVIFQNLVYSSHKNINLRKNAHYREKVRQK